MKCQGTEGDDRGEPSPLPGPVSFHPTARRTLLLLFPSRSLCPPKDSLVSSRPLSCYPQQPSPSSLPSLPFSLIVTIGCVPPASLSLSLSPSHTVDPLPYRGNVNPLEAGKGSRRLATASFVSDQRFFLRFFFFSSFFFFLLLLCLERHVPSVSAHRGAASPSPGSFSFSPLLLFPSFLLLTPRRYTS